MQRAIFGDVTSVTYNERKVCFNLLKGQLTTHYDICSTIVKRKLLPSGVVAKGVSSSRVSFMRARKSGVSSAGFGSTIRLFNRIIRFHINKAMLIIMIDDCVP